MADTLRRYGGRYPRAHPPCTDFPSAGPRSLLSTPGLQDDVASNAIIAYFKDEPTFAAYAAAQTASILVYRLWKAKADELRKYRGLVSALASANWRRKSTASSLKRPPVSIARTRSWHREPDMSSTYLISLSCRAACATVPSFQSVFGRCDPSWDRTLRKVMSMASWRPP